MDAGIAARFEVAKSAARAAGALLMQWYGRLDSFENKGAVDLVTVADKASEELLLKRILSEFPNDAILAEEGGRTDGDSGYEWILDPLDGTTNFVHAFPIFMVSIGVRLRDERVIGVCYGPVMDELFAAVRGGGATCNGEPIHVSDTRNLDHALISTGFPYDRRTRSKELLDRVDRVINRCRGIRRCGAAAYDQCWVASGRVDAFFEENLSPWDLAGGTLIIEEAGGRLGAYGGQPFDLFGRDVLLSNGHIHEALDQTVGPRRS